MNHIQLNFAFLFFCRILGEIHRELLLPVKKVTISETSTEILRKFVFLTMFEKWQILRKIWICLNNFFDQTSKMEHILTKTVFHPKVSHIQWKICFAVVLKLFRGNSQRTFLFSQKSDYLRNEHWNTQKVVFPTMLEKEQLLMKIWICLNNCFLSNQ